jgi:hypothetical protein
MHYVNVFFFLNWFVIRKSYAALQNLVTSLLNPNPDPNTMLSGQDESESEKTGSGSASLDLTFNGNVAQHL